MTKRYWEFPKDELRKGESARARFYRLKDELISFFNMNQLQNFRSNDKSRWQKLVNQFYAPIRESMRLLDEDPENEEQLEIASGQLHALADEARRLKLHELPEFPENPMIQALTSPKNED